MKNTIIHPLSELVIKIGESFVINFGKVGEGHPIPIDDPKPIKLAGSFSLFF